jgi:hypothetical protein
MKPLGQVLKLDDDIKKVKAHLSKHGGNFFDAIKDKSFDTVLLKRVIKHIKR